MPDAPLAKAPKVSVVMSVYNGEAYLTDAIQSVLDQTFTDFEFIIINDGSTDSSIGILEDFNRRDPRIRLIDQDNTGLTAALRTGCGSALGQYIARMDADDLSTPLRFEKQVAVLDNDKGLVAVTGDIEHFTDDGAITNVSQLRVNPKLLRFYNCFCNYIGGHGQVMFRRDAYEKAGGYDPAFRMAQDYDMWARLLAIGDFGNVPEVIYRYRTGHDNISKRSKDEQARHSLRTTRCEYERMTKHPQSEGTAMALLNFWWTRPPEGMANEDYEGASRAMEKIAKLFFNQHPDLRSEQFAIYLDIAARWFWWSKRVPPMSVTWAIFLKNFGVWGTKAVWARLRWGAN